MDGSSVHSAHAMGVAAQEVGSEPENRDDPLLDDVLPVKRGSSGLRHVIAPALVVAVLLLSLSPLFVRIKHEPEYIPIPARDGLMPPFLAPPSDPEVAIPVTPGKPSVKFEDSTRPPLKPGALVPLDRSGMPTLAKLKSEFRERANLGALFPDGCFENTAPAPFFKDFEATVLRVGEQYAPGMRVNLAAYARTEIVNFPRLAFRIYQGQGEAALFDLGRVLSYRNVAITLPPSVERTMCEVLYQLLKKLESVEEKAEEYGARSAFYEEQAQKLEMDVVIGGLKTASTEYRSRRDVVLLARDQAIKAGTALQDELREVLASLSLIREPLQATALIESYGARVGPHLPFRDVLQSTVEASARLFVSVLDGRHLEEKAKALFVLEDFENMLKHRVEHIANCMDLLKNFGCPQEELVDLLSKIQQSMAQINVCRWKTVQAIARHGLPTFFGAAI